MTRPNAITVARIAVAPLVALLPLVPSWEARIAAFVLFIVAAVTDYWDGHLARTRNLVTDLGRLLDPLADKLLLVGTFVPMWWLMRDSHLLIPLRSFPTMRPEFPFVTPLGFVALPVWIPLVVLGREAFMTVFRHLAARRGVVIAAIGPAKWKTTFQWIWVGAAYFWFFAATLASQRGWEGSAAWRAFAHFIGIVGTLGMIGAVGLTLYSLWLYLRRYARVFRGAPVTSAARR